MAQAAYNAVLNRCDIPNNRINQFGTHTGANNMASFLLLHQDELPSELERVRRSHPDLFSIISIKKLIAFRSWCRYETGCGRVPNPAQFTQAVQDRWLGFIRRQIETATQAAADRGSIVAPKFTEARKWRPFQRLFLNFLQQQRSALFQLVLTWALRENQDVEDEDMDADYDTLEEQIMATMSMLDDQVPVDGKRIWAFLKAALAEGEMFIHIAQFEASEDGRAAWLHLKSVMEGTSFVAARKAKAHHILNTTKWSGKNHKFTIEDYGRAMIEAHQDLAEYEVEVDPERKVFLFLAGIQCESIMGDIAAVRANPIYQDDFDLTFNFIKAAVDRNRVLARAQHAERSVKAVSTTGNPKKRGVEKASSGGGGQQKKARVKKPRWAAKDNATIEIKAGKYTKEEWLSLSKNQQDKVRKLRVEEEARGGPVVNAVQVNAVDVRNAHVMPAVAPAADEEVVVADDEAVVAEDEAEEAPMPDAVAAADDELSVSTIEVDVEVPFGRAGRVQSSVTVAQVKVTSMAEPVIPEAPKDLAELPFEVWQQKVNSGRVRKGIKGGWRWFSPLRTTTGQWYMLTADEREKCFHQYAINMSMLNPDGPEYFGDYYHFAHGQDEGMRNADKAGRERTFKILYPLNWKERMDAVTKKEYEAVGRIMPEEAPDTMKVSALGSDETDEA
jgi:uncharacterized protein YeaC (DUF1315 family)